MMLHDLENTVLYDAPKQIRGRDDAKRIVQAVLDKIAEGLARDGTVELGAIGGLELNYKKRQDKHVVSYYPGNAARDAAREFHEKYRELREGGE